MAVFENCSVLLELKNLVFKEKKRLKSAVTDNGGNICFVVNKQCSLIVTSDVANLSTNRLRSIMKHQTPVVGVDYVYSCLEKGVHLPVDEYKLDISSTSALSLSLRPSSTPKQSLLSPQVTKVPVSKAAAEPPKSPAKASASFTQKAEHPEKSGDVLEKFRIYTETDSDLPTYPDNFDVAKYSIFEKLNSKTWCVLELQSVKGEEGMLYRVVRYWKDDIGAARAAVRDKLVFLSTSEEALEVYKTLGETLKTAGLLLRSSLPPQAQLPYLGSAPLQKLLLEEKLNTGSLSQEVGRFVELLWTEALGCLDNILKVPVNKLSLNDISRVEGLLLQAQRELRERNYSEVLSLLTEAQTLLPLKVPHLLPNAKLISQNLDLCQLIRDVLNVSEMTLRSPTPSCLGKYRALRCSIETVAPSRPEFLAVTSLLQDSNIQIQQVMRVNRGVELQTFKSDLGNIKSLLHSSNPSNFVGILSRGLLLPHVGVKQHGIERTDIGHLGSGIYFGDAVSASLRYSKPSVTDGSRLLLVCDVALGQCKDVHKTDPTLTQAPKGHHSVHGVRQTPTAPSEFENDEYVVYSPDQVKLKYVVQFTIEGDQLKEFNPAIVTSPEPCLPPSDQELSSEDSGIESIKNPMDDVTAGLLDSSGQQLPLQAVHVKCKLMDLLSQVIIFQKYTNLSSVPIEAKYVFPLADSAAVCGFEAFINGKHVVGKVKEKEKARKEYKQAIERGHGAYLMDQDAPDVFTISVGNLPPGATVLIKVTFVSELVVRDGSILFSLPGSVAPWQESAGLNQTTQVTVEKVCVTDEAANSREFTLDMSIEMPYEISSLECITHKVKIKKTDCKAVVSVLPGEVMGQDGFQLSVTLSEVHMPRMWVEKHPEENSQACMLVFYPDFDISSSSADDEVILLLDTSESMKGESLSLAQKIALQVLKTIDHNLRLNVILFGTDHTEAFLTASPLSEARQAAESFIKRVSPVGGSTELWRPLRALSLLPPSRGVRNLLLLSDGHIQNAELTLQLIRNNVQHSRLFTCGLSPTANRHMLRALAQAGGGAFEFFDTKTKHNWAEKVASQVKRMASPGCNSVSVKWQQFNPEAPDPLQAPKQLHALFNDCHTLVYGLVPHCTQATLLGNLRGQELETMVSTSELQKTKGTFLHKLTARALIRDYEDGSLDANEAEHEGKKADLKKFIIELSKEASILSQFTSFVAIEERDSQQPEGFTDIPKLIAEEDVDFLPYVSWMSPQHSEEGDKFSLSSEDEGEECMEELEEESDSDMGFGLMDGGGESNLKKKRAEALSSTEGDEFSLSSSNEGEACMEELEEESDSDMGFGLMDSIEEPTAKMGIVSSSLTPMMLTAEACCSNLRDKFSLSSEDEGEECMEELEEESDSDMGFGLMDSIEEPTAKMGIVSSSLTPMMLTAEACCSNLRDKFSLSSEDEGEECMEELEEESDSDMGFGLMDGGGESIAKGGMELPSLTPETLTGVKAVYSDLSILESASEGAGVFHQLCETLPISPPENLSYDPPLRARAAAWSRLLQTSRYTPTSPTFSGDVVPMGFDAHIAAAPPPPLPSASPPPSVRRLSSLGVFSKQSSRGSFEGIVPMGIGAYSAAAPPPPLTAAAPPPSVLRFASSNALCIPQSRPSRPISPISFDASAAAAQPLPVHRGISQSALFSSAHQPPPPATFTGFSFGASGPLPPHPLHEHSTAPPPPPPPAAAAPPVLVQRLPQSQSALFGSAHQPPPPAAFTGFSFGASGPPPPPPPPLRERSAAPPPPPPPAAAAPPVLVQRLPQSQSALFGSAHQPPPPAAFTGFSFGATGFSFGASGPPPPPPLPSAADPPPPPPPAAAAPPVLVQRLPQSQSALFGSAHQPPPPAAFTGFSFGATGFSFGASGPPPPPPLPSAADPPPPPPPAAAAPPVLVQRLPQSQSALFGSAHQPPPPAAFTGFSFGASGPPPPPPPPLRERSAAPPPPPPPAAAAPPVLVQRLPQSQSALFGSAHQPPPPAAFTGFSFGATGFSFGASGPPPPPPLPSAADPPPPPPPAAAAPPVLVQSTSAHPPLPPPPFSGFSLPFLCGPPPPPPSAAVPPPPPPPAAAAPRLPPPPPSLTLLPTPLPSSDSLCSLSRETGFAFQNKKDAREARSSGFSFGSAGTSTSGTFGERLKIRGMGAPLLGKLSHVSSEVQSIQPWGVSTADPNVLKLRWTKIFKMQHSEGYWELTTELGELINVNVDLFANEFLKKKGIASLGVKAHKDILRLVATLLVLQLMRVEKLKEGKLLRTLFCLEDSSQPRPERWEEVKRAVDWVCWADRHYPSVYSRLEFGLCWESSTRQLLGYEDPPPYSPLSGLNLKRNAAPLLVH